ncbi:MAG: CsgG/HfaB family protein [Bacillota bacterium]
MAVPEIIGVSILLLSLFGSPAEEVDVISPEVTVIEESIEKVGPVTPYTTVTPELVKFSKDYGLPEEQRIAIGVGDIHDATGKFMSDTSSTQSRIIGQAPGYFIKSALQKLDYFTVLERGRPGFELFMQEQDLRGKGRLVSGSQNPKVNQIIGAPLMVTGAITSFQFDIETKGSTGKIGGSGLEELYAVASVQADFTLLDTTTSELEVFSYLDTLQGKREGLNIFSFAGSNLVLDLQSGSSEEAIYDLVVRRVSEKAALDIAQSSMVKRYMDMNRGE